jgi:hypothetical protein
MMLQMEKTQGWVGEVGGISDLTGLEGPVQPIEHPKISQSEALGFAMQIRSVAGAVISMGQRIPHREQVKEASAVVSKSMVLIRFILAVL